MDKEKELKERPIPKGWTKEKMEETRRLLVEAAKEMSEAMKRGEFPK